RLPDRGKWDIGPLGRNYGESGFRTSDSRTLRRAQTGSPGRLRKTRPAMVAVAEAIFSRVAAPGKVATPALDLPACPGARYLGYIQLQKARRAGLYCGPAFCDRGTDCNLG